MTNLLLGRYRICLSVGCEYSSKGLPKESQNRHRLQRGTNTVEVLGWWMERKIRGEAPRNKLCIYNRWLVDPDLLSKEAILSNDLVSVYDIVMSIQDQQLILSLPIAAETDLSTSTSTPPLPSPSPIIEKDNEQEQAVSHASIVITYGTSLWKKLRGLARLNDSLNYSNSTNSTLLAEASSSWDDDIVLPSPSLVYLKSRQDALEHFLKFSLAAIDKESYW